MLGWDICIWRPLDQHGTPAHERRGYIGGWACAGTSGLRWLDVLVSEGRAECLGGNGYPLRYRIAASELAATVRHGPPVGGPHMGVIIGDDYVTRSGAVTGFKIDWQVLDSCPPDEQLHLDAWDQS